MLRGIFILFLSVVQSQNLRIYVYDASYGLAESVAPVFLDKKIDAIYHTSIVMCGREYYFGLRGIVDNVPMDSGFGTPIEVLNFGTSQVDCGEFREWIDVMRKGRFKGKSYNIMLFNCNTFSNTAGKTCWQIFF